MADKLFSQTTLQRLIKQGLPPQLKTSAKFKESLQTQIELFVILATKYAAENCIAEERKMVSEEDLEQALAYLLTIQLSEVQLPAPNPVEESPSKPSSQETRSTRARTPKKEITTADLDADLDAYFAARPEPQPVAFEDPEPCVPKKRAVPKSPSKLASPPPRDPSAPLVLTAPHSNAAAIAATVLLAQTWDDSTDPTGWLMSEKLDGVRAYWSGSGFYSRNGNKFESPSWFTAQFPPGIPFDGELWGGRQQFQKTVGTVKKKVPVDEDWKLLKFCVFDIPFHPGGYEERLAWLKGSLTNLSPYIQPVLGIPCQGFDHLKKEVDQVVDELGGEGIMLRQPGSIYEHKRSFTLLKVKKFRDDEALAIDWKSSGVLFCKMPDGGTFGLTIPAAAKVKVGDIVTFKYQELTNNGLPRFPNFLRIRKDVTWEEVCNSAKAKIVVKVDEKQKLKPILFGVDQPTTEQPCGEAPGFPNVQNKTSPEQTEPVNIHPQTAPVAETKNETTEQKD